ncbi:MAG: hypothetical protein QXO00_06855 [Candidatus Bathyarchaeia archaeon]
MREETEDIVFNVFATDDVADQVVVLPKHAQITAEVTCVFGTYTEVEYTEKGILSRTHTISGFLIETIKSVEETQLEW